MGALVKAYNLSNILATITIIWSVFDFFQAEGLSVLIQYFPILTMIVELILFFRIFEGTIENLKAKGDVMRASYVKGNLNSYIKAFIAAIVSYIIWITLYNGWILFAFSIGILMINIYLLTIFSGLSKLDIFENDQDDGFIDRIE